MLLALLCAAATAAAETLTAAEPTLRGKQAHAPSFHYGPQFSAYSTQLQQVTLSISAFEVVSLALHTISMQHPLHLKHAGGFLWDSYLHSFRCSMYVSH